MGEVSSIGSDTRKVSDGKDEDAIMSGCTWWRHLMGTLSCSVHWTGRSANGVKNEDV